MNNRRQIEDQAYLMLKKNNVEGMRSLIKTHSWLLEKIFCFHNCATLLHEACRNDQTLMVELLLSLGADVNSKKSFHFSKSYTPLSYGVENKIGIETIKVLIKYHADLNFGEPVFWAYR